MGMGKDLLFEDRAGRRVRIVLFEEGENGHEFPVIDTARGERGHKRYRRPAQALHDFVMDSYKKDLANDSMYIAPTLEYLVFKQDDVANFKKMWSEMIHNFGKQHV
jgi:hypothetical protein